jgi:hypothetical protein
MKRTLTTMIGVLALGSIMWAQGAAPPPPPPLEPGASQADVDKALLAATGAPARPGHGDQVEHVQLDVHHAAQGHQPDGVLRPIRHPGSAALLRRVHGGRQPAARGAEPEDGNGNGPREADRGIRGRGEGRHAREARVRRHLVPLQGADQATARTHTTIAVPGATGASLGLPENGKEGVLWVMDAGTSTAHLMIPGQ